MSEIVKIKPLPTKGRTQFGIYPNSKRTYIAAMHPVSRNFVTGLTAEDEVELGKAIGADLSNTSKFWVEYNVVLTNKEEELDLEIPSQKLQYLLLKVQKDVATNRDSIKPYSLYIMYNEVAEAEREVKAFDKQLIAYKYLADMSIEEQSNFLKLFGYKTHSMKPLVIKKTLKNLADTEPEKFINYHEDKDREFRIMFEDLVSKGIVKIENGAYYHGETMLGADLKLTIANIKNPKKQDLLIVLKKQLEETAYN